MKKQGVGCRKIRGGDISATICAQNRADKKHLLALRLTAL